MMLHTVALMAAIAHCAPRVAPSTMAAIIHVESGGNLLAIGDNTTMRSYYPHDRATAEVLAQQLIGAGHSVDLGIAQINNANLARLGLNVHTIFDPCTNLNAGAKILSQDYAYAMRRYGPGQVALRHAIGMYNTGRLDSGARYVRRVLIAAAITDVDGRNHRLVAARQATRSALSVRVSTFALDPRRAHRETVSPVRAPILISVARSLRVRIF
ncbi:MAG: lytic transglycosylase domain-containing protein [Candidatus Eremiobacteraeota bacterium]|nr:lytic transglycosylase domain-containing protein [Candidatus Eremiobacteraeota bacterium]